ncbi:1,4-beta-xylanase, partial [Mycobacterium tuberculosis]
PRTRGGGQGKGGEPGRRSTISARQRDNADGSTGHRDAAPAEVEGRSAERAPGQRPSRGTEDRARAQGSTGEGSRPRAKRHNGGAGKGGGGAGKTQTEGPGEAG